MANYHRLTPIERYQIATLKDSGLSINKMAKLLKRSASSLSRELKRNSVGTYKPIAAQRLYEGRRSQIKRKPRIDIKLGVLIERYLLRQWSPEQIAAKLRASDIILSTETIYQYIYKDYKSGGRIYINLRRRKKWRRSRAASRNLKNVGKRANQTWIDERPGIVELRERIGDYERDTMLGKKGTPVLLTIVDRTSRLTKIAKIKTLNARLTHKATVQLLKKHKVRTITNDNGPEFALHHQTAKRLRTKIYFNHPYSSWERGTNENTNGLIRQYYPKGYDFNLVTSRDIKKLEHLLNTRPRKCLGFKTPLDVHKKLSRVLR